MTKINKIIIPVFIGIAFIFAIHFKGTSVNQVYLVFSCLFLLAILMIVLSEYCLVLKAIPITAPLILSILWILWLFTSTTWSQTPYISWIQCWVIAFLPFGFLLGYWIKPFCKQQILWTTLLFIVLFYAGWGLAEFVENAQSTQGPMVYQGNFGGLFPAVFMPLCAYYLIAQKRKPLYLIGLSLLLVALFSTYSRGSMLSYLVVLPLLFFSAYKQGYAITRPAITVLVLTVGSYLFVANYGLSTAEQQTAEKTLDIANAATLHARLMLWQSMLAIYLDHPWLGTGLLSFLSIYPAYRNPEEVSAGGYGHNDYLQFLQEGGPILLTFLLLPLFLIGCIYLKAIKKAGINNKKLEITGYALGSATLFIHAGVDFIFYNQALALLAGLLLAMAYQPESSFSVVKVVPMTHPKLTLGLIVFGLLLGWSRLAVDTYIHDQLENQVIFGKKMQKKEINSVSLLKLYHLNPQHLSPLTELAKLNFFLLEQENDPIKKSRYANRFIFYTGRILQLNPLYHEYYYNLALLLRFNPELKPQIDQLVTELGLDFTDNTEEQLLKLTLRQNPGFRPASINLAAYYQFNQHPELAITVLKESTCWFGVVNMRLTYDGYLQDQLYKEQIEKTLLELTNSSSKEHAQNNKLR